MSECLGDLRGCADTETAPTLGLSRNVCMGLGPGAIAVSRSDADFGWSGEKSWLHRPPRRRWRRTARRAAAAFTPGRRLAAPNAGARLSDRAGPYFVLVRPHVATGGLRRCLSPPTAIHVSSYEVRSRPWRHNERPVPMRRLARGRIARRCRAPAAAEPPAQHRVVEGSAASRALAVPSPRRPRGYGATGGRIARGGQVGGASDPLRSARGGRGGCPSRSRGEVQRGTRSTREAPWKDPAAASARRPSAGQQHGPSLRSAAAWPRAGGLVMAPFLEEASVQGSKISTLAWRSAVARPPRVRALRVVASRCAPAPLCSRGPVPGVVGRSYSSALASEAPPSARPRPPHAAVLRGPRWPRCGAVIMEAAAESVPCPPAREPGARPSLPPHGHTTVARRTAGRPSAPRPPHRPRTRCRRPAVRERAT